MCDKNVGTLKISHTGFKPHFTVPNICYIIKSKVRLLTFCERCTLNIPYTGLKTHLYCFRYLLYGKIESQIGWQ